MTATEMAPTPASAATPRILASWYETGRTDLSAHLAVHGPLPGPDVWDARFADLLVEAIREAGLKGRGGAAFPAARKLDLIRSSRPGPSVIVNAMEGEPASQKDRMLLATAPHLVLDGAQLVGMALGAQAIAVCVADDQHDVAARVSAAIAERAHHRISPVPVKLFRPPRRYITGEESALVSWMRGGRARPAFRPTKGVPLTISRQPVLVHNAETLAHVALIARHGPDWFRSVGLPDAPGTTLVTVSGAVQHPGVYEVALGTPISAILEGVGLQGVGLHGVGLHGADLEAARQRPSLSGVLVGGYGGAWLHPSRIDTPYAPGPLAAAGSAFAVGILAALPGSSCGVAETARVAAYMAGENAGQCGPCIYGLPAIADDLARLARGDGNQSTVNRLQSRLEAVAGRGACGHPDGVVRFVRSALKVFAPDLAHHARHHPCPGWKAQPVLPIHAGSADRRVGSSGWQR
jgi:NADH:ubiquinone oxidoreductase subunit F (NADH-binding)